MVPALWEHDNSRYYEGGISSVYLWDLDSADGFAGVVLMKKCMC